MLYPLKFNPILKEMIWGGQKIPTTLNLDVAEDVKIGENFVVSGLPNDLSVVANGELAGKNMKELIHAHKGDLLGEQVYNQFADKFPLLIKFIDANDDLSIQVHPNDDQAKIKHNTFGKTEMWYVMDQEPEATLISGFSKVTSQAEFAQKHNAGEIMDLMQKYETKRGDLFFIPAGKVHSIGSGNLIAEIQQTSDITYRIYDFDRKDKFGNSRELHHELALEAMNYADNESGKVEYAITENSSVNVVDCQYFRTNVLSCSGKLTTNYSDLNSFVIYVAVEGTGTISANGESVTISEQEAVLIPAALESVQVESADGLKILEVYIP